MYWGAARNAKADRVLVERKLDEFAVKITEAQHVDSTVNRGSENDMSAVQKVAIEFDEWADEFTKQRHLKRLQVAQSKLGRCTMAAEVTAAWKPYLGLILDTIRGMIRAYNAKTSAGVKVDLPVIPDDLFSSPYSGSITWGPNGIWRLETRCTQPARRLSALTVWIYFNKGTWQTTGDAVVIIIGPKVFEVFAHGQSVLVDVDRHETPIAEFETVITQSLRQLVEAQLVELEGE